MARAMAYWLLVALWFLPAPARAGAWTLPESETQILLGVTYSRAGTGFNSHGRADLAVDYEKTLVQVDAEYGWNDWLTLILAPEYAHARLVWPHAPVSGGNDAAVAAGARLRLFKDIGIVAVQGSVKTAGAFDMSVSANGAPGTQVELRVLYGTGFTLFGRHGFFDAEIGQRWIAGARADEVPIDLTLGLRVTDRSRVMLQTFNVIAEGNARSPYLYYRMHKFSLSVVTDIRPGLCLESGGYITAAGQNALVERGFTVRLWIQF